MNRHAAVLAADSASTVTRWVDGKLETRYFKGANKIFQLSHYQPIGLMIFNSADLLQVPWEILIKGFRDELSEKTFNNLDGYAEEFFAFLDGNTRFFPESVQNDEFFAAAQRAAIELVFSVVDHTDKLKEADNIARLEAAIVAKGKALDAIAFPKRITADHEQRAIGKHADAVAEKLAEFFELPQDLRKTLAALSIRDVFKRPAELFSTAGLVFAGFGDHDIFPHMIEYRSAGMLEGTQVIGEIQRETVDHSLPATLNAFAQTSMSDTFSVGFSEDVYLSLMGTLRVKLEEFAGAICAETKSDVAKIENLNKMISDTTKGISDGWFATARRDHAYPLRRVLGALPVEEMAELAETLVNLQSLKEKVTKPSASVGGPVDVAIITKNEGLVWVKRKLFFDANLNPRYLYRQQAKYV